MRHRARSRSVRVFIEMDCCDHESKGWPQGRPGKSRKNKISPWRDFSFSECLTSPYRPPNRSTIALIAVICMLRKDDPVFKKVVYAALTKAMTSGDAEKIYTKWFMNPIPPKGLNLGMPLSEDMKALLKAPSDKAFE